MDIGGLATSKEQWILGKGGTYRHNSSVIHQGKKEKNAEKED